MFYPDELNKAIDQIVYLLCRAWTYTETYAIRLNLLFGPWSIGGVLGEQESSQAITAYAFSNP